MGVQAPFFLLLLTQVSMKAMLAQPSSTLAYLAPSHLKALPAFHFRTSASKQRCRRAKASWKASGWPEGMERLGHEIRRDVFGQEAVAGRDRAAPIDAVGLAGELDGDGLGFFLAPAKRAFGAGDDDAEVVLVADADLGGADEGFAAVAELAIDREVVVQQVLN